MPCRADAVAGPSRGRARLARRAQRRGPRGQKVERGEDVTARQDGPGPQVLAVVRPDAVHPAAGGRDRRGAVAEAQPAPGQAQALGERDRQHPGPPDRTARRAQVGQSQPRQVPDRPGLVRRRPGLRGQPCQRGPQPLAAEGRVEQVVGRLEEPSRRLAPAPLAAQRAHSPQQPARGGCPGEHGEHAAADRNQVCHEPAVRGGVRGAARGRHGRDRGLEVDVERDAGLARPARRSVRPRVGVDVAQPAGAELELLHDQRVTHHHVQAGTPVDPVAGEPLDGRDRAPHDRVALDHLHVKAGPGEVARRHQGVVPRPDDDDVA